MKANDPLGKLLQAAARAERFTPSATASMPYGWENRILREARRSKEEVFAFLPLFRGAVACAAAIALISASIHFMDRKKPDLYDYTLNYSLASAYIE